MTPPIGPSNANPLLPAERAMSTPARPDLRLDLSVFDNAWDNAPKAGTSTLTGLARALTTFPVRDTVDKLWLPAWPPARFHAGSTRRAAAVVSVCCLVLDFDAGDPDEVIASWLGVLTILHSTWSHAPDAPRFRVVVPLARPVPVGRWSAAWAWASSRSPGAGRVCKDPSRLYFQPALPGVDAPHF